MSKPNERSCRIFLEKLSGFPPPPLPDPFFLWQNFFFEFPEKKLNFVFNETKFCTAEFIEKNFQNFLQSISLKTKFNNFSENLKKSFAPKKGGHRDKNPDNFSRKIRHYLSLGFDVFWGVNSYLILIILQ